MAQKPGYFRANFFDARYWLASGAVGGATGKYYNAWHFRSLYFKAPYWIRPGTLVPPVGGELHGLPFLTTMGRLTSR